MSSKQKKIMLYFNIVALVGILWSGFLLGRDIHNLLRSIGGLTVLSGQAGFFFWQIDLGPDVMVDLVSNTITVNNYLFIVSLSSVLINIILINSFNVWNKDCSVHQDTALHCYGSYPRRAK